ncbi:MAG: hypothetical protein ABIK20_04980 [Candidatus Omnitrophota bacterium]
MELDELEKEIINLAGEIRKETLPESMVPSTLSILQYSSPLARVVHSFNSSPLRGEDKGEGETWRSRLPILVTLLLLFLFIPFFSFNSEPALNIVRLVLLLFSLAAGTALFFRPEQMAGIDRKILGGRLSRLGPIATRSQEILLFRIQAIYFMLIAVFICRL